MTTHALRCSLAAALALTLSPAVFSQTSLPDQVVTSGERAPIEALVNANKADLASKDKAQAARKKLAEPLLRSSVKPSTGFRITYSGVLMPVLAPLVGDPSEEVAVNAARLSGLLGTKEGLDALSGALKDKREAVRVAAATAMASSLATCRLDDHAILPSAALQAVATIEAAMKTETSPRVMDALVMALDGAISVPGSQVAKLRSDAADAVLKGAENAAQAKGMQGAEFDPLFVHAAKSLGDALQDQRLGQSDPLSKTQRDRAAGVAGDIAARAARRVEGGKLTDAERAELQVMVEQAELVQKISMNQDFKLGSTLQAGKDDQFKGQVASFLKALEAPPYSMDGKRFEGKP